MTKHAAECVFIVLALIASITLATKREIQIVLAAVAIAACVVGIWIVAGAH